MLHKIRKKQIVVGMSGGVDSSMSLLLLQQQGWEVVGVSLKYAVWRDKHSYSLRENVCCSEESFTIAQKVCQKLNVPYYIVDVSQDFEKKVIAYFLSELKNNRTPNPCIICNRYLKFQKLFAWAQKHHIDYIATGHYSRIRKNEKTRQYELLKAKDSAKDQTYSLSFLPQKWLPRIIFPLGNYTKEKVLQLAQENGFDFYLKRKQSQDFCFVAGKCMNCFLQKEIGKKEGIIKDTQGNILGKHQGLHFYTIGQRKGIELAGGPYFVVDKILQSNTLVVCKDEQKLMAKEAILSPFHFISLPKTLAPLNVSAKIRSQHLPSKATLVPFGKRKLKLVFQQPQKAIVPGQFAVFYQKQVCLGGGRIIKAN